MTTVILDHNSAELVRCDSEATTTTTATTQPTSPGEADSNCKAQ